MVKLLLGVCILFIGISGKAQDDNVYFSEAIAMHLAKYDSKAKKAYRTDDVERAKYLFDSLVNNCLKGTYMDNFKVRDLNKKIVPLNKFEKPLFLITRASWIVPTEGETPALNELAAKYNKQVDFIVLFWDKHSTAKELAKQYHKSVKVLYVDELQNESNYVVRNMKHSLGFPTSFLLDPEKRIVNIKRNVSHPYGVEAERSYELNFNSFSEGISQLLIHDTTELSATTE